MSVLATVLAAAVVAGSGVNVTLTAPGHAPRIKQRWYYTVRASRAGKPVAGLLTVQIVDPIGGVHPVEYGLTTKKITRRRFPGFFRDFIIWPASSRGIPLTLRLIVVVAHTRKIVTYAVTPRR